MHAHLFYLDEAATVHGPLSEEELLALHTSGKLTSQTRVRVKGDTEWTTLAQFATQCSRPPINRVPEIPRPAAEKPRSSWNSAGWILAAASACYLLFASCAPTWRSQRFDQRFAGLFSSFRDPQRVKQTKSAWDLVQRIEVETFQHQGLGFPAQCRRVALALSQIDLSNVDPELVAYVRGAVAIYRDAGYILDQISEQSNQTRSEGEMLAAAGYLAGSAVVQQNPRLGGLIGALAGAAIASEATQSQMSRIRQQANPRLERISVDSDRLQREFERLADVLSTRYGIPFIVAK